MDLRSKENKTLQPFLKWAGGKRWLLNACPTLFSAKISGRYVEPFLGGAAIYAATAPKKALISDINEELINLYMCIRDYQKKCKRNWSLFIKSTRVNCIIAIEMWNQMIRLPGLCELYI